jgi:predicted nucleotide-binding protein|tara:strand:- start:66 stop:986 length:921 start_codon:yes stop_codon:yes gene_type:complete
MELGRAEKTNIERYFDMPSGYVLHYSNRTFEDLFHDFGIDIYSDFYSAMGNSKANRLRLFIKNSQPDLVKSVLLKMLQDNDDYHSSVPNSLSDEEISKRVKQKELCLLSINNLDKTSQPAIHSVIHPSLSSNNKQPIFPKNQTQPSTNYQPVTSTFPSFQAIKKQKVFIVHGHDEHLLLEVENLCRKLNLEPIVLKDQSSGGATIIEKLENYSDAHYAIILYTECDEGRRVGTTEVRKRARQNVIFEHGYFIAKLGRKSVASLIKGDIEIQGDIGGVVYINYSHDWKYKLAKEMKDSGLSIDLNEL